MPAIKIKKAFFLFNGIRYYRTKSEDVELGNYGEKQTPVAQPNFLAVHDQLAADKMALARVRVGKPTAIDWSKETKAEVGIPDLKYLTLAGGQADFSLSVAKDAKLVLVKFSIDNGPLITVINSDSNALDYVGRKGLKRVASDVWVVMEAELAEKFGSEATLKANATIGVIELEVSASLTTGSKSKVTLAKGTTFAYLLQRPSEWDGGKAKLVDMKPDQQGLA